MKSPDRVQAILDLIDAALAPPTEAEERAALLSASVDEARIKYRDVLDRLAWPHLSDR